MSNEPNPIEGRFELGDLELLSGSALPRAHISFAAYGTLNAARDNVIVYPTWYALSFLLKRLLTGRSRRVHLILLGRELGASDW
jgi:hypothetical protein